MSKSVIRAYVLFFLIEMVDFFKKNSGEVNW